MQAAQSNNASDTFNDTDTLKTGKRVLPSPFAASLQAARKYLERQRGVDEPGAPPVQPTGSTLSQDRRLERSLYEGHSIEAGLNFGAVSGLAGFPDPDHIRTDGAVADIPASLFSDAASDPAPDPEVVRGAILRLARESQAGRLAGSPPPPPQPLAFRDVARQVWSAEVAAGDAKPAETETEEAGVEASTAISPPAASCPSGPELVGARRSGLAEGPALAHDAGNLLSALGLYSELLCFSGVLDPRHRHYADDLKLLAARSQLLIERLLRLGEAATASTAPDAGMASPAFQGVGRSVDPTGDPSANPVKESAPAAPPISLRNLVLRWGSLLSTLAHGTLEVNFGPHASLSIAVGAEPLERILVNLVRNARAATRERGAIRIGVGMPVMQPRAGGDGAAPTMVLTVDDSGCGMTEEQVQEILGTGVIPEPGPGNWRRRGLGLQIVRELVAESGGSLFIHSRPGTGTRIEIHWPTVEDAAAGLAPVPSADAFRSRRSGSAPPVAPAGFSEDELRWMMPGLQRTPPADNGRGAPLQPLTSQAASVAATAASATAGISAVKPSKGAIAC